MSDRKISESFHMSLFRAMLLYKHKIVTVAEGHGLTLMQSFTLCLLEPGKPVPMSSLSSYLRCDASNVTGIIDRLLVLGLVERTESTQDRRIKVICLTARGEQIRATFLEDVDALRVPELEVLNDNERNQLEVLLQKITDTGTS